MWKAYLSHYVIISIVINKWIANHIPTTHIKQGFLNLTKADIMIISIFALMMTSSNGNIFRVTGPLCGEFTGPGEFPAQRPVTRSFDVSFDLRLNTRLSKQPWGWWFETLSWSLWRQCNDSYWNLISSFYSFAMAKTIYLNFSKFSFQIMSLAVAN